MPQLLINYLFFFFSFHATFDRYDGEWSLEQAKKNALSGDSGLVLKSKAKHSAIAARLKKPFHFEEQALIVQYEINFQVS